MKAIFPGSFDPLTSGHLDLIRRALQFADELLIAIMVNPDKPGFLPAGARKELVEQACREAGLGRFEVLVGEGLLSDLARARGCRLIVRGVRNAADLDSESAMARANALLLPGLETVLLPAAGAFAGISSSLIRQIASFHGDISHFVPPCVELAMKRHFLDTHPTN